MAFAQDTRKPSKTTSGAQKDEHVEDEGVVRHDALHEDEAAHNEVVHDKGLEDGRGVTTYGLSRPRVLGKARSEVTREEMARRLPRSAPDALRYEPGVFVQQTAHSQGSAYIRGRTGQQTVLLFDDVRLNNALFRQGPNQYFFTIDARTIAQVDVVRGSSSTRHGSDAISGVLHAHPIEPSFGGRTHETFGIRPRVWLQAASADSMLGGRLELDAHWNKKIGLIAGAGYRNVGPLEGGGPISGLNGGQIPEVPRFDTDGRTQLGTGFREFTSDARLVALLSPHLSTTLTWVDYRQFDAPRTDQCPPAYAPFDECLVYDEQFRTLVSAAFDARKLGPWLHRGRLIASWQRQHERRTSTRPSSYVINGGRDDVDTFGLRALGATRRFKPHTDAAFVVHYGAELYHDLVDSAAWISFTDLDVTRLRSRGQYLAGSSYTWSGAFVEGVTTLWSSLHIRAGGRLSLLKALAPQDVESGTLSVDRVWTPATGNLGVEWWVAPWLTLIATMDGAFRAPNLDDMTSRQRTGPGYQLENAKLEPERGITYEVGARVSNSWLELDAWAYASTLDSAIARTTRDVDACAKTSSALDPCRTSWTRLQLINLDGSSHILGAEGSAKVTLLPRQLSFKTTLSFAWGDGPAPLLRAAGDVRSSSREPLSRIPPLNGTVEGLWHVTSEVYVGGSLRWAANQERLALQDISDERIPRGGTPGFSVFDLRAGYTHHTRRVGFNVVFENLTDSAYRYHGSSVNGPGRSLSAQLKLGW